VHGIVFLKDGTIKIHAGKPDMRVPIAYALTYPSRQYESYVSSVEEFDTRLLPIEKERYPLFFYGLDVVSARDKGELVRRIAFNSADEVAVEYFLERKISFGGIYQTIRTVVEKIGSEFSTVSIIEDVFNIDMLSRRYATEFLKKLTDNYR
ncbi:MAG TPA: 1-deoxy-D-xylulose-5-phosphate reductoisomerase, partial [Fervidobacterium sp.]|nr:1-deoxy-D-xylulose-5-phosphate reductoisomerase [Fervidobacterium sp.]